MRPAMQRLAAVAVQVAGLVLGYALLEPAAIDEGIRRLREVLRGFGALGC